MSAIALVFEYAGTLRFRESIWLFPIVTAIHFLEEAPRFTVWAQKYASPKFTYRHWKKVHVLGFLYALVFSAIVSAYPNRFAIFLFFALCFFESGCNLIFHAGASVYFRSYSPGLITAFLYVPALWITTNRAYREGLLLPEAMAASVFLAVVVHSLDVARNVFFWPPRAGGNGREGPSAKHQDSGVFKRTSKISGRA